MMILKSRYFTFKAAINKPVPMAVIKANKRNKGSINILTSGTNLYQTNNPIKIKKEIKKSIKQTITVLAGTINLGKYTLVSKLELAISELADSENELAKNCQGNIAAQTIIA